MKNTKIKQDSFVTKFAKTFLDNEGAWYREYDADHNRIPYSNWQLYRQGKYREQAVAILTYFLTLDKTLTKDELVKHERRMWRKAGFPDGYPELEAKLWEIINDHLGL